MRVLDLLDGLEWHDSDSAGRAQALQYDRQGRRALRWTLRPGQVVKEFVTDQTPIHVVVLLGEGVFTGGDGEEHRLGPNSLIVFDEGEPHSARALRSLVFVAFLHDART